MAKKEGNSDIMGIVKSSIFSGISNLVKDFKDKVQEFILRIEEKAIELFYASALFITGFIFISIALVLLLAEYFNLSRGWGFLIIGFILTIFALIIRNKALNNLVKRR